MLEKLRKSDDSFFVEEEQPPEQLEENTDKVVRRRTFDQWTGTNAFQRFVLALMLLVTISLMGGLLLILTEKVALSFLI